MLLGKTEDTVLIKKNGDKIENMPASVQSQTIFIEGDQWPIEEGDCIQRTLPNGLKETYFVIDRGFYNQGSFGPHYQCKVKKQV